MQVKELKKDGLNHALEVTVGADEIEKMVESRLKDVAKSVRISGFRPGKAPLNIMKQRYGKAVMGEVLESAVNDTSQNALSEKGLRPALQPKIEVKSFDEGKDLVYTMEVETLPEFKLGDFKGLKLERQIAKPDDKSIDEALERIAEQNTKPEAIKGDRASKDGDVLLIDFHGRTAEDNVEHDGMHSHDHALKLGSGSFIPGFEDQLIGKKAGEKVEVKVTFPEQYGAQHLAGRDAIFDVDVKEIQEAKAPKVDDEFAKSLGLDDLKALRDAVAEQIQKEFDQHSRLKLKKVLLDQLDDMHDMDIPPSMLDMEYQNILQQIQVQAGRNPQDAEKDIEAGEKEELKSIAERRVRLGLILAEIGNQNNTTVSDIDLQKAVIAEAQKYPGQEKEVFDYYAKNQQALESIRAPLFEEKVVDYILELAEVKDKEVSIEELTADDEDDAPAKPKKKAAAKSTAKKTGEKKEPAKKAATKKPASKSAKKKDSE